MWVPLGHFLKRPCGAFRRLRCVTVCCLGRVPGLPVLSGFRVSSSAWALCSRLFPWNITQLLGFARQMSLPCCTTRCPISLCSGPFKRRGSSLYTSGTGWTRTLTSSIFFACSCFLVPLDVRTQIHSRLCHRTSCRVHKPAVDICIYGRKKSLSESQRDTVGDHSFFLQAYARPLFLSNFPHTENHRREHCKHHSGPIVAKWSL